MLTVYNNFGFFPMCATMWKHWCNNRAHALVVKWISYRSSEPLLGVRIPPGAPKNLVLRGFCVPMNIGAKKYETRTEAVSFESPRIFALALKEPF